MSSRPYPVTDTETQATRVVIAATRAQAIYHVAKRFAARPMSAIVIARLPEGTTIEEARATQEELPDGAAP